MSAYDLLIERGEKLGMEKGMEKGLSLGDIRKARKVVLNLLAKFPDWTNTQIAEVADTTIEFVQQIRNELN